MKSFFLAAAFMLFLAGTSYAQCPPRSLPQGTSNAQRSPDAPQICLESFEMCNNWARHYCYPGSHEQKVNELLRQKKERGVTITTAIIKAVAKSTLKYQ
ncbi:hypothetical protein KJ966_30250 [bacterium]|nr:hypothetical protein [bacterium]